MRWDAPLQLTSNSPRSRTRQRSSSRDSPLHTAPAARWRTAKWIRSHPSAFGVRFSAAVVWPGGTRADRYNKLVVIIERSASAATQLGREECRCQAFFNSAKRFAGELY